MSRTIATPARAPYFPDMAARFLRLMVLLALVLMPVRMAAEAHVPDAAGESAPMAEMAEHCAEPDSTGPDDRQSAKIDCMMACAALPASGQPLERLLLATASERPAPDRRVVAASYAADPPPPRFS